MVESAGTTRVFAVAENAVVPADRMLVPPPGAVVPVSFEKARVGTVAADEQMIETAFTRQARFATKNVYDAPDTMMLAAGI